MEKYLQSFVEGGDISGDAPAQVVFGGVLLRQEQVFGKAFPGDPAEAIGVICCLDLRP